MIKSTAYLAGEFLLLFVILPLLLVTPILIWIKVVLVIFGFTYLLLVLRKSEGVKFRLPTKSVWPSFFKRIGLTFLVIAIFTTVYVWNVAPQALFYVPLNKPLMFAGILLGYSLLSVWPQEIIYRTFFLARYTSIFKNTFSLVFVNALVFSLAHIFFKNTLVIIFTFIGGALFALTYVKYKSTTLVTIEHAIYGNWLFTVGMGEMLAFPGMENSGGM